MKIKLYVGNVPKATTQSELNTLFAQAGEVTDVNMIKDRHTGESRGFAFITMDGQAAAELAISMFNAYAFHEQLLKVSLAKPVE